MCKFENPSIPEAVNANNTVTQKMNIFMQLNNGARHFDIRPILGGGYRTGHYHKAPIIGWQGARGESIDDIIDHINRFTASHKELIILNLSHSLNTSDGYHDFTENEWHELFNKLLKIESRFISNKDDLTSLTLNDFISGNKAAVVIVVQDKINDKYVNLGDYAKKGFYHFSRFEYAGNYSNTNSLNVLRNGGMNHDNEQTPGQFQEMRNYWKNHNDDNRKPFVISWTLTPSPSQIALGDPSIISFAIEANNHLNDIIGHCTKDCYPNIISIDNIGDGPDVLEIAMFINTEFALKHH